MRHSVTGIRHPTGTCTTPGPFYRRYVESNIRRDPGRGHGRQPRPVVGDPDLGCMGNRRHDIRRGRRRQLGLRGAAPPSAPASHLGSASAGLGLRTGTARQVRRSGATLGCDACDACDGQVRTPEGYESPGILRLSADPTATAKCELWVRRQVRTRRSRKPRDSAAFGRSGAHLSATGATGRFAPRRTQNLGNLRLSGRQVRRVGAKCEPGITPCRWRCIGRGPPVSVFAKEGPR